MLRKLTHMLSCREATRLLSQRQERALTTVENVKLRLHLCQGERRPVFALDGRARVIVRLVSGHHDNRSAAAIDDYIASVLPGKPDERAVLGVDTRELPVIATPQGRA